MTQLKNDSLSCLQIINNESRAYKKEKKKKKTIKHWGWSKSSAVVSRLISARAYIPSVWENTIIARFYCVSNHTRQKEKEEGKKKGPFCNRKSGLLQIIRRIGFLDLKRRINNAIFFFLFPFLLKRTMNSLVKSHTERTSRVILTPIKSLRAARIYKRGIIR